MEAPAFAPLQQPAPAPGPATGLCSECSTVIGVAGGDRYSLCLSCAATRVYNARPVRIDELQNCIDTCREAIRQAQAALSGGRDGRPVPWFAHGARVARLGEILADGDDSPVAEVFRRACRKVYARGILDVEETRAVILAGCEQYGEASKQAAEAARKILEILA